MPLSVSMPGQKNYTAVVDVAGDVDASTVDTWVIASRPAR